MSKVAATGAGSSRGAGGGVTGAGCPPGGLRVGWAGRGWAGRGWALADAAERSTKEDRRNDAAHVERVSMSLDAPAKLRLQAEERAVQRLETPLRWNSRWSTVGPSR